MRNITLHPCTAAAAALVLVVSITGTLAGCSTTESASSSSSTTESPATPRLDSADNFRDVAGLGAGYVTADGTHVKRGVVYRANALALKPADVASVQSLGVQQIWDLRTPSEIEAKPDAVIPGATWTNENVIGTLDGAAPAFDTPEAAVAMMEGIYRGFVTSPDSRKAIAATLTGIANGDGAHIIHCTAGKDRTGWISALLLHMVGVDRALIDQNFMLSNQYSRGSISSTLAGITAQKGPDAAAAYAPVLGVEQSFLNTSFDEATKEYGSVDGYLRTGLGLSQKTLDALKAKLTA